jgi:hypothetical protein
VESKSWCLGMLRECLVYSSMRLGVPFIAPRQLGAVKSIPGRQFLHSVAWRTGLSGAHRIVRCPLLTVGSATRRAWIPRPTVGPAYCWLTGQSGAPPDSPVNFSRTPPTISREQQVRLSQSVRCTTGQSGAPRPSRLLAASSHAFPIVFSPLYLICTLSTI